MGPGVAGNCRRMEPISASSRGLCSAADLLSQVLVSSPLLSVFWRMLFCSEINLPTAAILPIPRTVPIKPGFYYKEQLIAVISTLRARRKEKFLSEESALFKKDREVLMPKTKQKNLHLFCISCSRPCHYLLLRRLKVIFK